MESFHSVWEKLNERATFKRPLIFVLNINVTFKDKKIMNCRMVFISFQFQGLQWMWEAQVFLGIYEDELGRYGGE